MYKYNNFVNVHNSVSTHRNYQLPLSGIPFNFHTRSSHDSFRHYSSKLLPGYGNLIPTFSIPGLKVRQIHFTFLCELLEVDRLTLNFYSIFLKSTTSQLHSKATKRVLNQKYS